ncbi:MAG: helix-turn-helix domain-containing protein [Porticoccaceae bacterium]|jgi:transcriptional regulator with XRE-family HTH domain
MNVVGPKIRQLRQEKGWTQEALAARCNILDWDISRGTLAKIESQLRRVTDQEAVILARALRVEIEQIYRQPEPAKQT